MWSSSLSLLSALALVSYVSATSFAPRAIPQLLARQTTLDPSIIPDICQTDCAIIVSTIQTCGPPQPASCGCTLNEERGFVNCLNCILGIGTTPSLIEQSQSFVDQFVILCQRAGVSLPATTVKGGTSLITSTAPPPFSSSRPPVSASVTRPFSTSTSRSVLPSITDASGDEEDDFTTSQSRISQSTVTPSPTAPAITNSASSVMRAGAKRGVTAVVAAGVALVVFV